jgi:hypothetical protein
MKKIETEYAEFTQAMPEQPPRALSESILKQVGASLNPSPMAISGKVFGIHLLSGAATLLVCPQFGIGPLGGGHGIMSFFMKIGNLGCAMLCGFLFLGLTAAMAALALKKSERLAFYRFRHWYFTVAGVLSLATLMLIGKLVNGEFSNATPDFFIPWLVTGIVGALLITQLRVARDRV